MCWTIYVQVSHIAECTRTYAMTATQPSSFSTNSYVSPHDGQQTDALQVDKVNPWLTYTDAIHKMREFGASIKVSVLTSSISCARQEI